VQPSPEQDINCPVQLKIARGAPCLLGFAMWVWTIPAQVVQIYIAISGDRTDRECRAAAALWRDHLDHQAGLARRYAELAARADEQHQLWMPGDERGLYSRYPAHCFDFGC
jgi:hypothetical protein